MINLKTFRDLVQANKMSVETILTEIYTAHTAGFSDFAIFDGGAHKGYHTSRFLNLPGCMRVYAVEADPYTAQTCRELLASRHPGVGSRLHFIEAALQNDPSVTAVQWKSSPSHAGRSSLISANTARSTIWTEAPEVEYRDNMQVAATTIDKILENEHYGIPFIKLDLEGADLMALTGASETLRLHRPLVAFENSRHAPEVHGFTLEDMVSFFDRLDYVPIDFAGRVMRPDNWFGFFEAWAAPRETADWLSSRLPAIVQRYMAT